MANESTGREETNRFGLLTSRRETLGTSLLDAIPKIRIVLPGPTMIPFFMALAVSFTFVSVMIDLILVPIGALLTFLMLAWWHWPKGEESSMEYAEAGPPGALPTSIVSSRLGTQPPYYWGMTGLILIEVVVFAALITTYFYLKSGSEFWPQDQIDLPDLTLPVINTLILVASSLPIHLADSGIRKGNQTRLKLGLIGSFILGLIFLVLKYVEYSGLNYDWTTNAYASIKWTVVGFHSAHVIALLLKTLVVGAWAFRGHFNERRNAAVQANGLYWHFVVIIWIPLFFTLYLSPYLF